MGDLVLDAVTKLPCVIRDTLCGLYAPKGWMYWSKKPWTFDVTKAKVYRNSSGAKNASRGCGIPVKVLEFHKEYDKWRMRKKTTKGS